MKTASYRSRLYNTASAYGRNICLKLIDRGLNWIERAQARLSEWETRLSVFHYKLRTFCQVERPSQLQFITRETLRLWSARMANQATNDLAQFAETKRFWSDGKVGSTLRVKLPADFKVIDRTKYLI